MIIGYKIKLDTIEKVNKFTTVIETFENDIDIISGRYIVDAKSIMGIFSLDLTRPLEVIIRDASISDVSRLQEVMEEFRVNEIWKY